MPVKWHQHTQKRTKKREDHAKIELLVIFLTKQRFKLG